MTRQFYVTIYTFTSADTPKEALKKALKQIENRSGCFEVYEDHKDIPELAGDL